MASATGTGTKPRIRIRDATQADADTIAAIHFDAFGPGVMGRLLNRNQHVVHPETLKGFAKALFAPTEQPPNAKRQLPVENVLMVAELVREGEGDEIIAFAKWKIVEEQLSEEEWNVEVKDKTQEEVGEWTDVEVHNAFIRALNRQMMGYQRGEACVYLNILACKTTHHRTGAGSALLRWGVEKADREGKAAYLEASPAGYPLYRRFGFEDLGVQDLPVTERWGVVKRDGEDWGTEAAVALAGPAPVGVFRTVFMKRLPRQT